ncbi:MAG: hypothetical protein K6E37_08170 [Bacteroidales bacterium]|nr:hypothetical protein [Bacteroidales bacterium]
MKSRKVIRGILNHCYQRTVLGFVLFYNVFDCLVYFTLFCTIIKKFDIKAVALTLMPNRTILFLSLWCFVTLPGR